MNELWMKLFVLEADLSASFISLENWLEDL